MIATATASALTAIAALASLNGGLIGALVAILFMQQRERKTWATERRQLIDRIIARHTGEVIALDRADKVGPKEPTPERLIEGLS